MGGIKGSARAARAARKQNKHQSVWLLGGDICSKRVGGYRFGHLIAGYQRPAVRVKGFVGQEKGRGWGGRGRFWDSDSRLGMACGKGEVLAGVAFRWGGSPGGQSGAVRVM